MLEVYQDDCSRTSRSLSKRKAESRPLLSSRKRPSKKAKSCLNNVQSLPNVPSSAELFLAPERERDTDRDRSSTPSSSGLSDLSSLDSEDDFQLDWELEVDIGEINETHEEQMSKSFSVFSHFDAGDQLPTPSETERGSESNASSPCTPPPLELSLLPSGPEPPVSPVPAEIVQYSHYLHERARESPKPLSEGQPEVWADGRQALCEALPYFRSYQGSAYCVKGMARGYLFDKASRPRDYLDTDVLISCCGGGMARVKTGSSGTSELVYGGMGTKSHSGMQALRNNIKFKNAVAVISGDQNPSSPSVLPHPYNVLGWFKPTHTWFEKFNGQPVERYRLEKLDLSQPSWWRPQNRPPLPELGLWKQSQQLPGPDSHLCSLCQKGSFRIYLNGWMCLNKDCVAFWKLGCEDPLEEELVYDARFLRCATPWPTTEPPQTLNPRHYDQFFQALPSDFDQSTTWQAWKGVVCSACGRCNSKTQRRGWSCGNSSCQTFMDLSMPLIPAEKLRDFYFPANTAWPFNQDIAHESVKLSEFCYGGYRVVKYILPDIDGYICHFIATQEANKEERGANFMWKELQRTSLGFTRCKLPANVLRGEMLTQHFAVNFGAPYKFIATTNNRSFEDGGPGIAAAIYRLNQMARQVVDNPHDFNEMLAIAYFENQSISYHDDGEKGVGPTIASITLGSSGTMKFKLKDRIYHGVNERLNFCRVPPTPLCKSYKSRIEALRALDTIEDPALLRERLQNLPTELGLDRKGGPAPVLLSLHLAHGDIMVMHGQAIQKYCDHAVTHEGRLRFGLTCRYIDPNTVEPVEVPRNETVRTPEKHVSVTNGPAEPASSVTSVLQLHSPNYQPPPFLPTPIQPNGLPTPPQSTCSSGLPLSQSDPNLTPCQPMPLPYFCSPPSPFFPGSALETSRPRYETCTGLNLPAHPMSSPTSPLYSSAESASTRMLKFATATSAVHCGESGVENSNLHYGHHPVDRVSIGQVANVTDSSVFHTAYSYPDPEEESVKASTLGGA